MPLQDVQSEQLVAPAAENVPLAHTEQVRAPLRAYVPAGHCVHVTLALDPLLK